MFVFFAGFFVLILGWDDVGRRMICLWISWWRKAVCSKHFGEIFMDLGCRQYYCDQDVDSASIKDVVWCRRDQYRSLNVKGMYCTLFVIWPLPCRVRLLGRSKTLIKRSYFLGGGDCTGILPGIFPRCVCCAFLPFIPITKHLHATSIALGLKKVTLPHIRHRIQSSILR